MKFSLNFVSAGTQYGTLEIPVAAPYIVKDFDIKEKQANAEITVCGLGFYELYINGENITKGLVAPYVSNPDHMLYYDNYEIADKLKPGKNTIGIILGNGFMNNPGGFMWDFDDARFRGVPRVAIAFESDEVSFEADESFLWHPSPVLFDDFRCGVHYDARLEITGWNLNSCDRSAWRKVVFAEAPRGQCRLCEAEPVTAQRELQPLSVKKAKLAKYKINPGTPFMYNGDLNDVFHKSDACEGYLYDFGINAAGIYRLKIKGRPGQRIEIQASEYLNRDGEVEYSNAGWFFPESMSNRDVFYCSGSDDEFILPFTYHGCRYYFVMGLDENQATAELLTYIVANSNLKTQGGFKCSDPVANAVQDMILCSDLANFYYFPTDCPHREKNGWTGDAVMSAEQMILNFDVRKSFTEWMRNIVKALNDEGYPPGIVPTSGWGYDRLPGPVWDTILVEIPYQMHIYYGDINIIEISADAIWRYLNYIIGRIDQRGLVEYGHGDWCPPDRPADAHNCPLALSDSIITMYFAKTAAYLFEIIGRGIQRDFAKSLEKDIKKAIRANLIDFTTMTAAGSSVAGQAMAIYFDAFNDSEKARACDVLVKLVHRTKCKMDFGMIGSRTVFHVLTMCGEYDLAYRMITREDSPSYGNQIARGRTALPENFSGEDAVVLSLNHHFFGDVSAWFIKRIAGILVNPRLCDPGEVNIQPAYITAIDYAEGYYKTIHGNLSVKWQRQKEGGIILEIAAPEKLYGKIILPDGYVFVSDNRQENDMAALPLKAGKYLTARK